MKHYKSKAQGSALTTLIGGIVILLAVLFLLVKLATSGYYSDVADNTPTAVETRIMPVGKGSAELLNPSDPDAQENRRVTIVTTP